MAQQFFYDAQIRRFMLQFARIFSNFQVEFGLDGSQNATLLRVPVRYGDASRQAQTIIQENSANSMPSTPLITFYIVGLEYDRPRMQEPSHVNKIQVRQRTYDSETETYETTPRQCVQHRTSHAGALQTHHQLRHLDIKHQSEVPDI